jgi:hypothetical protein
VITISVESDEEEQAVRAAHEAGELDIAGLEYVIRRGRNAIGGRGSITTCYSAGGVNWAGGAGGGGGSSAAKQPTPGGNGGWTGPAGAAGGPS